MDVELAGKGWGTGGLRGAVSFRDGGREQSSTWKMLVKPEHCVRMGQANHDLYISNRGWLDCLVRNGNSVVIGTWRTKRRSRYGRIQD